MSKPANRKLSKREIVKRAANIRLVLADNDGVMTDTGVYYSEQGEAFKRFSIRDGMGVERLREAGIETAIITGELSGSVRKRAEKLRLRHVYLGVRDKLAQLQAIFQETGLSIEQLAYIGDDVNDLDALRAIRAFGLTAAPADAMEEVRKSVHYNCKARGGDGAFREFAELILSSRGTHRS